MAVEDPNELKRVDREIRINELKHRAAELAGGDMASWESEKCPPELAEQFWRHVVDYETAPLTCHFDRLQEAGVELSAAHTMTDKMLTKRLWEVIHQLGQMNVFLYRTDHLSDRELYTHLWEESLREAIPDLPFDESAAHTIDMLGACSEQDIQLSLRHYAGEEERRLWHERFPEDVIPPHEDPPYDRDRFLPKWKYE